MTKNHDPFELFLQRLEPRLSSSIDRYLRLRAKLIKFFEWKRCGDTEGLADEAIGRLVRQILAGEQIAKPSAYVYAIALNVYKEEVRRVARLSHLRDVQGGQELPGNYVDPFTVCARHCLEKLASDKRVLLEQYYSESESREEIARRLGTSLAGLRTKIHRIRIEVKECYDRCIMKSS